jgi:hypothetical protein
MATRLEKLLVPFKDRYYKVFDPDTNAKLLKAPLGKKLVPNREPGTMKVDFVVAKGHPLFYHHLFGFPVPVTYFEVKVNKPQSPARRCEFTFFASQITKIRELTVESPEFDQQLLALMATKNEHSIVREFAVELLSPDNHALIYRIATTDPSANVCGRAIQKIPATLYKDLLAHVLLDPYQKYNNGAMRAHALEKLDPETDHQLIAKVAEESPCEWTRVLATEKLDPNRYPELVLQLSYQETTAGDIQAAAIEKLHPVLHKKRLIEIINTFDDYPKIVSAARILARSLKA